MNPPHFIWGLFSGSLHSAALCAPLGHYTRRARVLRSVTGLNVSGTAVRDRDPPTRNFFPKSFPPGLPPAALLFRLQVLLHRSRPTSSIRCRASGFGLVACG